MEQEKTCNHVFTYRARLYTDICSVKRQVKTNIDFFKKVDEKYPYIIHQSMDAWEGDRLTLAENMVEDIFFTKEEIQKMKEEICKKIMESENPFDICCSDLDGGYSYKEGELLEDKFKIQ